MKTEPPERIAAFLEGVVQGEAALSGAIARRLLDRVRTGSEHGNGVPDAIASRLSARELEVLLLLDEHLGTDEIAMRLFISEHTVRSHVKSLLRKLGVSSRREALERLSHARRRVKRFALSAARGTRFAGAVAGLARELLECERRRGSARAVVANAIPARSSGLR